MEPTMGNTKDTMRSKEVYTRQRRIAELSRKMPELAFTSLNHHMDMEWLKEAYRRTRKSGAAGVDGQTAEEYEKDLKGNLQRLMDRAKSGTYYAPPVKRVYIPKGTRGEKRPIGIPTLEDKILQRAVTMTLEPIYEQDFKDSSYGFRPKRGAHQALREIWKQTMDRDGKWIIDLDISKYFDTIDRRQLRKFLDRRVRDGVIRRLIGKWLKAGVLEGKTLKYLKEGTPQGGVISPLLSNVYLHEVLDTWFEEVVKPRLKGSAFLVRFADDCVIGLENEEDARRVMEVLSKRFSKYGLTIHPEKTRLVDFRRPRQGSRGKTGFDFLGFTHYWGKSRKGRTVVKRKTMRKRISRSLKAIGQWCRKNRHRSIEEQQEKLNKKLKGHYRYYGITGNGRSLLEVHKEVVRIWRKWLNRRSRKQDMPWERFKRLLERHPLAPIKIYQSVYTRT